MVVAPDEEAFGVKVRPTSYSDSHQDILKNIDDVTAENYAEEKKLNF